ncbi:MAG: 2Fe-2S iron-sulfur cluster-binding protein [Pseudomonadota bacterium]
MAKRISISRAARVVGVKRGVLQQSIARGELQTFEGELDLADLLHHFPNAVVEDNTMLERVEQIIETTTYAREADDGRRQNRDVLAKRIMAISRELAFHQKRNKAYNAFFNDLELRLAPFLPRASEERGETLDRSEILQWLMKEVERFRDQEPSIDDAQASDLFLRVMSAQVTVIPSGHEFFVEGADSILEAGLRGGLALDYGCSNGNCGRCKVRVASGETKQIRHHDYVLTESEKSMGYVLGCSHTPLNDLVIEAEEANDSYDIARQALTVRFKKIDKSDPHTAIVSLKTSRTRRLRFLAGQSIELSVEGVGSHTYPIASCPCDDMNLQIHLPLNTEDPMAQYFSTTAKVNDPVDLLGPEGAFSLNEDSPNSLVFIALDEGFAPVKALIEHAMALDTAEHIVLLRFATQGREHYLHNLCRSWNDALDNFDYLTEAFSVSDNDALQSGLQNLHATLVASSNYDYYVCGSSDFADHCEESLTQLNIANDRVNSKSLI